MAPFLVPLIELLAVMLEIAPMAAEGKNASSEASMAYH